MLNLVGNLRHVVMMIDLPTQRFMPDTPPAK